MRNECAATVDLKRRARTMLTTELIQHHVVPPLIRQRCYGTLRELALVSHRWHDAIDAQRVQLDYNDHVRSLVDALVNTLVACPSPTWDEAYRRSLRLRKHQQWNDAWLCVDWFTRSPATYNVDIIYDRREGKAIAAAIERYADSDYLARYERQSPYSDRYLWVYAGTFNGVLRSELSALAYNLMVTLLGINGTYRLCMRKLKMST